MKYLYAMILWSGFGITIANGQFFEQDLNLLNRTLSKKARKFETKCQSNNPFQYVRNYFRNKKNIYYPIVSCKVSEKAIHYDSSKEISDFLKIDPNNSLYDYIGQTKEGLLTGCGNMIYENGEVFGYSGMRKMNLKDISTVTVNSTFIWSNVLNKGGFQFLFRVSGFKDILWFIRDQEIYLVTLSDLKVYDPDTFIKSHCSVDTIHKLAKGKLVEGCF